MCDQLKMATLPWCDFVWKEIVKEGMSWNGKGMLLLAKNIDIFVTDTDGGNNI